MQLGSCFYFDSAETMATKRCLITCRYNFYVFKSSQLKGSADFLKSSDSLSGFLLGVFNT